MAKGQVVAAIVLVSICFCAAAGESRTWTSKSGTTVEAELEGVKGESVVLRKPDGTRVTIPKVNYDVTTDLTVAVTINTGHTIRLNVVTSNTVFGEVQRMSAERDILEVTSRGRTESAFNNVRQAGTGTLSKCHSLFS